MIDPGAATSANPAQPDASYYREILDSLTQGVVIHDCEERIIYANLSAAEMLGLDHEKMLGQKMSDLVTLIDEENNLIDPVNFPNIKTLRTGEPVYMKTFGVLRADADRRWLMVQSRKVELDDGYSGVSCSFMDITQYRRSHLAADLLVALNGSVVHTKDEDALLQNMCDIVVKTGGYALAVVAFPEPFPGRRIRVRCASGATDYLYESMISWSDSLPTGQGPAGIALRTGEVQVVNDMDTHPGYGPWRERARWFGFRSSIALLFKIGKESVLLSVYAREKYAFDEVTVKFLKEIASEFGLGVEHVRSIQQLGRSLDGTMAALSRLSESHDPYISGHETRVGALGAAIARKLGMDEESAELIRKSGQVHDIGKIAVPMEFLTRPGPLRPLEFEIIKSHTSIGADILSQASLPWPIAEVANQHHEKMNGSGYPNGLKGKEIALPARIIAVADVVEAMSQHRPYRPARGLPETLSHLVDGSGTLYDSEAVEACLEVFKDGFTFETSLWTAENEHTG